MEDWKKYADIVFENGNVIVATVWTGRNFYIDIFDKHELTSKIEYLETEFGIYYTLEEIIAKTHVSEMEYLCRHEDYSNALVQDWIRINVLNVDDK